MHIPRPENTWSEDSILYSDRLPEWTQNELSERPWVSAVYYTRLIKMSYSDLSFPLGKQGVGIVVWRKIIESEPGALRL